MIAWLRATDHSVRCFCGLKALIQTVIVEYLLRMIVFNGLLDLAWFMSHLIAIQLAFWPVGCEAEKTWPFLFWLYSLIDGQPRLGLLKDAPRLRRVPWDAQPIAQCLRLRSNSSQWWLEFWWINYWITLLRWSSSSAWTLWGRSKCVFNDQSQFDHTRVFWNLLVHRPPSFSFSIVPTNRAYIAIDQSIHSDTEILKKKKRNKPWNVHEPQTEQLKSWKCSPRYFIKMLISEIRNSAGARKRQNGHFAVLHFQNFKMLENYFPYLIADGGSR